VLDLYGAPKGKLSAGFVSTWTICRNRFKKLKLWVEQTTDVHGLLVNGGMHCDNVQSLIKHVMRRIHTDPSRYITKARKSKIEVSSTAQAHHHALNKELNRAAKLEGAALRLQAEDPPQWLTKLRICNEAGMDPARVTDSECRAALKRFSESRLVYLERHVRVVFARTGMTKPEELKEAVGIKRTSFDRKFDALIIALFGGKECDRNKRRSSLIVAFPSSRLISRLCRSLVQTFAANFFIWCRDYSLGAMFSDVGHSKRPHDYFIKESCSSTNFRNLPLIDLMIEVPAVNAVVDLLLPPASEGSGEAAARVTGARQIQIRRYAALGLPHVSANAAAPGSVIEEAARPDVSGMALLRGASERLNLSAHGFHRVLKLARTTADLDGAATVGRFHLAEALSYRINGNQELRAA
jgi:hypothetical protein